MPVGFVVFLSQIKLPNIWLCSVVYSYQRRIWCLNISLFIVFIWWFNCSIWFLLVWLLVYQIHCFYRSNARLWGDSFHLLSSSRLNYLDVLLLIWFIEMFSLINQPPPPIPHWLCLNEFEHSLMFGISLRRSGGISELYIREHERKKRE